MFHNSTEYGEGLPNIPEVPEPTILFIVNKTLTDPNASDELVYRATNCCWVIGERTRNEAVYALGVKHGVVRGAYRIDRWIHSGERRWKFEGVPAPELNVVGTSVARIKPKRGNSSPFRFYRGGISRE